MRWYQVKSIHSELRFEEWFGKLIISNCGEAVLRVQGLQGCKLKLSWMLSILCLKSCVAKYSAKMKYVGGGTFK